MNIWRIWGLAAILMLVFAVSSCTTSPTVAPADVPVNLEITFRPTALTTLIDSARLRIIYPASADTFVEFPTIHNGMILDTLTLRPGENIELYLAALADNSVVLYEGYDTVSVVAGGVIVSSIYMEPVVSLLRPSPLYRQISVSAGEEAVIGIDLYNVSDLFGSSFRIYYDESLVEVVDVLPGTFLGDGAFFFYTIEQDAALSYVAIGITRRQDDGQTIGGVDGSGRLAEVVFRGLAEGSVLLNFDTGKALFTNSAGSPIPEFSQIVFETGEIEVVP